MQHYAKSFIFSWEGFFKNTFKWMCFHKTEGVAIELKKKSIASVFLLMKTPSDKCFRIFNPAYSCSTDFFFNVRGIFRTLPNIFDEDFSQKQLTAKSCQQFLQKSSIIDVWHCPNYTSGHSLLKKIVPEKIPQIFPKMLRKAH